MTTRTVTYPSANGVNTISAVIYTPDLPPVAVLQIAHGMVEHGGRYLDFATFLVSHGFVVAVNDHAGHGLSHGDLWGYMGDRDGQLHMVSDMRTLFETVKDEYPDLPYLLLGHSMGSFLARAYSELYPQGIDGFIYSGTGNAPPGMTLVVALARLLARLRGRRTAGRFFAKVLGSGYDKRFEHRTNSDWLSRDQAVVDKSLADPQTQFIFTYGGYLDLFRLLKLVSRRQWYEKTPKDAPVLLFSGDQDPVGNYGADVRLVEKRLKERGNPDVTMILYPGGRHEMLNELNHLDVYEDVYAWCEQHINIKKEKRERV